MRYLLLAVLSLAVSAAGSSSAAPARESSTWISGGAIQQPINWAGVDEDAFARRVSPPERLEQPPVASGRAYTLQSPYWGQVLPGRDGVRPPASAEATYYPEIGLVRARQGGEDAWLGLDLRQRAIVERYIRLGEAGQIGPSPFLLEVLGAAAAANEPIGVQIADRQLSGQQASLFWASLRNSRPAHLREQAMAPASLPSGSAWVVLSLPEGRSISLLYRSSPNLLTDFIGGENYSMPPDWLVPILGSSGAASSFSLAPAQVPQDKGTGSPLWWAITIGLGLALLGTAVHLGRGLAGDNPIGRDDDTAG